MVKFRPIIISIIVYLMKRILNVLQTRLKLMTASLLHPRTLI
nr:MAG TPA: hypothetical protein [Caudoviricetes sp.]